MILKQIMNEPEENHEPQHQKVENNSQYQLSEPKTDQNNFVVQAGW